MITDALLAPLVALLNWLESTLPDGAELEPGSVGGVVDYMAALNTMLPVSEMLALSTGLLATVAVFMTVRLVLVVRHTLLP